MDPVAIFSYTIKPPKNRVYSYSQCTTMCTTL